MESKGDAEKLVCSDVLALFFHCLRKCFLSGAYVDKDSFRRQLFGETIFLINEIVFFLFFLTERETLFERERGVFCFESRAAITISFNCLYKSSFAETDTIFLHFEVVDSNCFYLPKEELSPQRSNLCFEKI